jgi:hypothetical protein
MPTHMKHLARSCYAIIALVVALTAPSAFAQRAGAGNADRAAAPTARKTTVDTAALPSAVADFARSQPSNTPAFTVRTGRALNEAIAAVNAKNYAGARAALGQLRLDRLSPYELGKTEQIFAAVALGERHYGEARQHLQNAVDSGGLSPEEAAEARRQIEQFDAGLATAAPT